jgi:hypothetical protein
MQRVKFILGNTESLKIRWFRKGINSNARERAVVIHGAKYLIHFQKIQKKIREEVWVVQQFP